MSGVSIHVYKWEEGGGGGGWGWDWMGGMCVGLADGGRPWSIMLEHHLLIIILFFCSPKMNL